MKISEADFLKYIRANAEAFRITKVEDLKTLVKCELVLNGDITF